MRYTRYIIPVMKFHLPEYTFDQFCEIARKLVDTDIRNLLAIAKLAHSIETSANGIRRLVDPLLNCVTQLTTKV